MSSTSMSFKLAKAKDYKKMGHTIRVELKENAKLP